MKQPAGAEVNRPAVQITVPGPAECATFSVWTPTFFKGGALPLTDATRTQIRNYLLQEVTRYIAENLANLPAMETQPFHARLMPALFGTALSERSFSTRLGLWFQRMALLVAGQFNRQAEMNYLVTGQLQPAAEAQITAIIAQMDGPSPKRIPNRQRDTTQVIGLQYQGGTTAKFVQTSSSCGMTKPKSISK